MKKIIKLIPGVAVSTFSLITLYDLLFNGWFESPTTEVDWWAAGAGSSTLLIRSFLVPISVVLSVIMVFQKQSIIKRVTWLSAALIIPVIFSYSASGIERYSDSYDEDVFLQITRESEKGKQHTQTSVAALLGAPLSKDRNNSIWSYTYMPSCGYGWTKRTFKFDTAGKLIGWDKHSEP